MNHDNIIHDRQVEKLADRLREKGTYDTVETHIEYWRSEFEMAGEMDIRATRTVNGIRYVHYYEYKCNYLKGSRKRAKNQARRFYNNFGNNTHKFILISEECSRVERIKPGDLS